MGVEPIFLKTSAPHSLMTTYRMSLSSADGGTKGIWIMSADQQLGTPTQELASRMIEVVSAGFSTISCKTSQFLVKEMTTRFYSSGHFSERAT